ncbi:transmembrane amino acid transporter protein-domain-containing protein [Aspergillus pseudoustus]|uniref:Transmembrane amino acid transporter protein-domain-containing protein n=1 Tax=Aspergillus pseudoustus TaxID=1810923 RepID=A0ABR4K8X5_9EURO
MRFTQVGGVNSIDNFARSWQRAACFPEVFPRRGSFTTADSDDEWHLPSGDFIRPQGSVHADLDPALTRPLLSDNGAANSSQRDGVPNIGHLEPSLGTSYGTISSRVSESARRHVIELHKQQQAHTEPAIGHDGEHLLVKQVQREDGTRGNVVVGQSTVPQTVFNSVNVLIGVGLLSLPLAMKHAGWLFGLLFLLFAALTTAYTAKILARCLDVDQSLVTYADLAYISFGHHARLIISFLFCLELLGACVALVVLFADSLHVLFPGLSIPQWQMVCGLMLIPLSFVPLRLLSVTSILGIISCTSIVAIICIDGFLKPHVPGSLREPAQTYLFPENWSTLPLSFGLIMSPWGGHGVFPNIYRDMRHPHKYGRSLWATYIFTYSLDCTMAILGWLMFGNMIRDEVTANVLRMKEYPQFLSVCIIVCIAIIPITKVPLNCRPLVATIEMLCGLEPHAEMNANYTERTIFIREVLRGLIRIFVVAIIVVMAIIFPSFDRIMALMGSALCFTICIILPLAFYLKIFGKEISRGERLLDWFLLIVSSVLAVIGTVWAFLPQELLVLL